MKMFSVSSDGSLVPLSFRIVSAMGGKDVEIPYEYNFIVKPNMETKSVDVELISPPGMHLAILEEFGSKKTDVRIISEAILDAIRKKFPGFTIGELVETLDTDAASHPKQADFIFEKNDNAEIDDAFNAYMNSTPDTERVHDGGPNYVPSPGSSSDSKMSVEKRARRLLALAVAILELVNGKKPRDEALGGQYC